MPGKELAGIISMSAKNRSDTRVITNVSSLLVMALIVNAVTNGQSRFLFRPVKCDFPNDCKYRYT